MEEGGRLPRGVDDREVFFFAAKREKEGECAQKDSQARDDALASECRSLAKGGSRCSLGSEKKVLTQRLLSSNSFRRNFVAIVLWSASYKVEGNDLYNCRKYDRKDYAQSQASHLHGNSKW